MCGRFTLRTPLIVLAKQFQFELDFVDKGPRYNIAPTQDVAAVRIAEGHRELAMLHWGLIPVWAKEKKIAFSTINARGEGPYCTRCKDVDGRMILLNELEGAFHSIARWEYPQCKAHVRDPQKR